MRIMKIDETKLQRLIDGADDARAAESQLSDRLRETRAERNRIQVIVDRQARSRSYGRPAEENVRTLASLNEEVTRLQSRYERAAQISNSRRAVAQTCEAWAQKHAGRRGNGSVILLPK